MKNSNLTKDGEVLLILMYKEYLNKLRSGESIQSSRYFKGCSDIQNRICPKATIEQIDYYCQELKRNEYIDGLNGDGIFQTGYLTDDAIKLLENQFSNNLDSISKFLFKAAGLIIPFI